MPWRIIIFKYKFERNDNSKVMVSLEQRIPSKHHVTGKSQRTMGNLGKPHNKCRNVHFTQWGGIVVEREVNTQMANWVPRCLTFVLSHWTRVHWWKCHSTRGLPKAQCPLPCNPVTQGWTVPALPPQQDQATAGAHYGMCHLLWFPRFLQRWAPKHRGSLPSLPCPPFRFSLLAPSLPKSPCFLSLRYHFLFIYCELGPLFAGSLLGFLLLEV